MTPHLIDRSTALCLACSSSLPPSKGAVAAINSIYMTNCCQRPICPSCISSNPRLARYDPCLACLGGIDVVASARRDRIDANGRDQPSPAIGSSMNLDGSVRDQDTFVLGDDDDEDDEAEESFLAQSNGPQDRAPLPPYEPVDLDLYGKRVDLTNQLESANLPPGSASEGPGLTDVLDPEGPLATNSSCLTRRTPFKYYLDSKDTLQGISLRFRLDGYEVCRLNNLPPSVLRTTPHLLHTRAFLLLPPSAKPHPSLMISPSEENGREEQLVRERAEKKLQTLTKEVDWRVAKAYVALAYDVDEQETLSSKRKETGAIRIDGNVSSTSRTGGLEALAIERYLDDEEWEAEQRRAGRAVKILPFPVQGQQGRSHTGGNIVRWWDRRKK